MNKKDSDKRSKLMQEKCNNLLNQLLRDEDNKYCVDCDAKGPRWASWNLGIFLCIRCAGIHRNLGVHISRVKSVNLDSWTPEQVVSLQQMGNSRARAVYEALLSDNFRRPQTDSGLESFIRAKYEQKKYIAREWIPPPPPKVDWDKEIDEELENQKRKKKSATSSTSAAPEPVKISTPVAIPAPLPKPKVNSNSPKTSRSEAKRTSSSSNNSTTANTSSDLLGLNSSVTSTTSTTATAESNSTVNKSDSFDSFLCGDVSGGASLLSATTTSLTATANQNSNNDSASTSTVNNLEKEEKDFFNQSINNGVTDKGKLTKDSILALYGTNSYTVPPAAPVTGSGFGFMAPQVAPAFQSANTQMFPTGSFPITAAGPSQPQQDQFFGNFVGNQGMFNRPPAQGQFMNMNHTNNFGNFAGQQAFGMFPTPSPYQQQFNTQKLNEDNIKKIESLSFNNLK